MLTINNQHDVQNKTTKERENQQRKRKKQKKQKEIKLSRKSYKEKWGNHKTKSIIYI